MNDIDVAIVIAMLLIAVVIVVIVLKLILNADVCAGPDCVPAQPDVNCFVVPDGWEVVAVMERPSPDYLVCMHAVSGIYSWSCPWTVVPCPQ